jgi:hypothetical protein
MRNFQIEEQIIEVIEKNKPNDVQVPPMLPYAPSYKGKYCISYRIQSVQELAPRNAIATHPV